MLSTEQGGTLRHRHVSDAPPRIKVEVARFALVADAGPDAGNVLVPLGAHTLVGRESWCDFVLTDPHVSGEHFELFVEPDGVRFRDLRSTNGTWMGDVRMVEAFLTTTTPLRVGDTLLRVVREEGLESQDRRSCDQTGTIIGACEQMQRVFSMMQRIAPLDLSVLLLGETGTGKTAVARAMHDMSGRASRPFVTINCAALPETLIESTLFGHVKGAYTGAHRPVDGVFEQARGGSVLLDEIGEMPLHLQAKLLSVLETRTVRPIGHDRDVPVDFRLFTATNRRLGVEVAQGRFRQDLYYRIAGFALTVPALRERGPDIPLLARSLLSRALERRASEGGPRCLTRAISDEACDRLAAHSWPGNVRELSNVVERALALAAGSVIQSDDILIAASDLEAEFAMSPADRFASMPPFDSEIAPSGITPEAPIESFKAFKSALLRRHEREYFQRLMAEAGGKVGRAAELAGISRTYVHAMLRKYDL